jgi:hypothetical protein
MPETRLPPRSAGRNDRCSDRLCSGFLVSPRIRADDSFRLARNRYARLTTATIEAETGTNGVRGSRCPAVCGVWIERMPIAATEYANGLFDSVDVFVLST